MAISKKAKTAMLCAALVLTLMFIWWHSLIPRADSARESTRIMKLIAFLADRLFNISIDPSNDHVIRKLAHFAEFGLLGTELTGLMLVQRRINWGSVAAILLAGLTAGCVDEYLQVLSQRGSMVSDVLLDYAAVIAGMLLVLCVRKMKHRRQSGSM